MLELVEQRKKVAVALLVLWAEWMVDH